MENTGILVSKTGNTSQPMVANLSETDFGVSDTPMEDVIEQEYVTADLGVSSTPLMGTPTLDGNDDGAFSTGVGVSNTPYADSTVEVENIEAATPSVPSTQSAEPTDGIEDVLGVDDTGVPTTPLVILEDDEGVTTPKDVAKASKSREREGLYSI